MARGSGAVHRWFLDLGVVHTGGAAFRLLRPPLPPCGRCRWWVLWLRIFFFNFFLWEQVTEVVGSFSS